MGLRSESEPQAAEPEVAVNPVQEQRSSTAGVEPSSSAVQDESNVEGTQRYPSRVRKRTRRYIQSVVRNTILLLFVQLWSVCNASKWTIEEHSGML